MADKDIHKRHFEIAKQMIQEKRLDEHHEMSLELQKAKSLLEFDAILDKYDGQKVV